MAIWKGSHNPILRGQQRSPLVFNHLLTGMILQVLVGCGPHPGCTRGRGKWGGLCISESEKKTGGHCYLEGATPKVLDIKILLIFKKKQHGCHIPLKFNSSTAIPTAPELSL